MSIEVKCSGCGQLLRVGDENAGKQARCPKCQTTFTIPATGGSPGPSAGGPSTPQSPFPQPQQPFGQQPQQPFGQQQGPAAFGQQSQNPFGEQQMPGPNPYASPQGSYPQTPGGNRYQPHRGGQILTFGILGIVCCLFFGIAAWVMGNEDLKKMDRGVMDPSGRGTTQAGRVCGIISVVLSIIWFVAQVLLGVLGGAAGM